jgi:site-specific DNA-methyltransferase (adenine-specific)
LVILIHNKEILMPKNTKTSTFGVSKREGHDSSAFYNRNLFNTLPVTQTQNNFGAREFPNTENWIDKIFCASSDNMPIPDNSVALAFTSPPYNVGKDYDNNMNLEEYLDLIMRVGKEVYRVLQPGGRYVVNIANLGRKPYIPMHAHFYGVHMSVGFLPMGEIIWQKGKGANGSCAWGSWKSAKSPRLRDLHEYLLVFCKDSFSRPEKGESDISSEEFMESTLSVWQVPPESAKKVGHPAPFSVELASRVIKLYSYVNDIVLDPFNGSGTTCVAAKLLKRHYVGFDISEEYCTLAEKRIVLTNGDK